MAFQIKTETLTEVIILYERINLNILFKDHFETTFMEKYETEYPGIILVHEDLTQHKLTINDNQQRVLIIETHANLQTLHKVFEKEGFEETILEEKKAYQIGNGFRKNLSDEWDMHIRFIRIHQNMIAIDGEVETSTKWLEHNTGNNWISIIYEISSILKKYQIESYLWHRKIGKYVVQILKQMKIQMTPIGKIQWKHVAIAAGALAAAGIFIWSVKKYLDSKDKKK